MAENPILSLSTVNAEIKRPVIEIDKKPYELFDIQEFSLKRRQRITSAALFVTRYFEKASTSLEDQKAIKALDQMIEQIVVDLPIEIMKKLNDGLKLSIVEAFNKANNLVPVKDENDPF